MAVLHIFDMDGTLLKGSTASLQIARVLNRVESLVALEARLSTGEIDTKMFAKALRQMWQDLTSSVVESAFHSSPWLMGIRDVCADIRARGERSAVITMSPNFFATLLIDLGFDEVIASRFPPLPFAGAVDIADILTPEDKVRVVRKLCADYAIERECCVAYGDSLSDAPLFKYLDATVAVNADDHLTSIASAIFRGSDLRDAYAIGRSLIPPSCGVEMAEPGNSC